MNRDFSFMQVSRCSLCMEIKTGWYSLFSTVNGSFRFHDYTHRGSDSSMVLLKENNSH